MCKDVSGETKLGSRGTASSCIASCCQLLISGAQATEEGREAFCAVSWTWVPGAAKQVCRVDGFDRNVFAMTPPVPKVR